MTLSFNETTCGRKRKTVKDNLHRLTSFGCPEQESNLHALTDTTP